MVMAFLTVQPVAPPPIEPPLQINTMAIATVASATLVFTPGAPPPPGKGRSDERNPGRRGRDTDAHSANVDARTNGPARGRIKDFFV